MRPKVDTRKVIQYIEDELEAPEIQFQIGVIFTFMICIATLRLLSGGRLKALSGEHTLDLHALNDANLYKEVFLAYLNAALLEPVLAIGGMQEVVGQELIINVFTLGSICWWIWLVTDAFDYTDVMQHFTYQVNLRKEIEQSGARKKKQCSWMKFRAREDDARMERQSLVGSLRKDIALWFMLACIAAAWLPGPVKHRDVLHAYVVTVLWIILHHSCRRATTWCSG